MNDARESERGVAPDGCPVRVYLLLPGDVEAELIHAAIPAGSAILELGCGVGRMSGPLVRRGHAITGVDNSTEMLAHFETIDGTETILADIASLDLSPRRWPVVLLASHFVNDELGGAFLAVAARHVSAGGCVLVQRYPPGWVNTVGPSRRDRPGMRSEIGSIERPARGTMRATIVYELQDHRYEQTFTAYDVDDERLATDGHGRRPGGRRGARRRPPLGAPQAGLTDVPKVPWVRRTRGSTVPVTSSARTRGVRCSRPGSTSWRPPPSTRRSQPRPKAVKTRGFSRAASRCCR